MSSEALSLRIKTVSPAYESLSCNSSILCPQQIKIHIGKCIVLLWKAVLFSVQKMIWVDSLIQQCHQELPFWFHHWLRETWLQNQHIERAVHHTILHESASEEYKVSWAYLYGIWHGFMAMTIQDINKLSMFIWILAWLYDNDHNKYKVCHV